MDQNQTFSAKNSNYFLATFNQIDKFLSWTLKLKSYVPYHERITMITRGKTIVTSFVRMFEDKLRYFGDLRNQIVHGYRLDQHHYLYVSDYALEQIQTLHDELIKPKTALQLFGTPVAKLHIWQTVSESVQRLRELNKRYAPVFDDKIYKWTFSEHTLFTLLSEKWPAVMDATLGDIHLYEAWDHAKFLDSSTSIYELEQYFEWEHKSHVLYLTPWGKKDVLIEGVISILDVPSINDHFLRL